MAAGGLTQTNFKTIKPVPAAKDFVDIVLTRTQRRTPTVVCQGWAVQRIRSFYMRKVNYTQQTFHEKLSAIVDSFPRLDDIHPFYADLINVLYDRDHYKLALGQIRTCMQIIDQLGKEYSRLLKFGDGLFRCKQLKRAALGRMCTLMRKQSATLGYLEEVRKHLARLPSIDPNARTLLVAGFPNVGKSSFMNKVTRADVEVEPYAFTTKSLFVGHMDYRYQRWQVIDTPGILDHALEKRNTIEMQAVTALAHLQCSILFFVDISEQCGYTVEQQASLFDNIRPLFLNKEVFVVATKIDAQPWSSLDSEKQALVEAMAAKAGHRVLTMSNFTDEGVMQVRKTACDALLAKRSTMKMRTGRAAGVLNRLTVTQPKARDSRRRPASIPPSVIAARAARQSRAAAGAAGGADGGDAVMGDASGPASAPAAQDPLAISGGAHAVAAPSAAAAAEATRELLEIARTSGTDFDVRRAAAAHAAATGQAVGTGPGGRVLERDLEAAGGGAGVFAMDWNKRWDLADPDWKYDVMPEIMGGKNVADWVDPDIDERLRALEEEEVVLEDTHQQQMAAPVEPVRTKDGKTVASGAGKGAATDESDPALAAAADDAVADGHHRLAQEIRRRRKIFKAHSRDKRNMTNRALPRRMRTVASDQAERFAAHGIDLRPAGSAAAKAERASKADVQTVLADPGQAPRVSRGRKRERRPRAEEEGADADMADPSEAKRARSRSKSVARSKSMAGRNASQSMRPEVLAKASKQVHRAQYRLGRMARKGEADRHIPDLKPKHLFSGKRNIKGTTDWR